MGTCAVSRDWFVTNGEEIVGPVATSTLLRGLDAGKIGAGCSVWQNPWKSWRPLETVREISALSVPNRPSALERASEWLDGACDPREIVALALSAIATETRATVALAHRVTGLSGELETRSVVSERVLELLGARVAPTDAAMRLGRLSPVTIDGPSTSDAFRATANRLREAWIPVAGTALAPLFRGTRLIAVVELAKSNRPFRRSDRAFMRDVARLASRRLASSSTS